MKSVLTPTLLLAACATFICSSARAGTYANDFNSDPADNACGESVGTLVVGAVTI